MPGRHPAQIGMKKAAAELAFFYIRATIGLIMRHPGIDFDCIHPFISDVQVRLSRMPGGNSEYFGSLCGPYFGAPMLKSGHFRFFHTK